MGVSRGDIRHRYAGEGAMSTCVVPIRGIHVARKGVVPL